MTNDALNEARQRLAEFESLERARADVARLEAQERHDSQLADLEQLRDETRSAIDALWTEYDDATHEYIAAYGRAFTALTEAAEALKRARQLEHAIRNSTRHYRTAVVLFHREHDNPRFSDTDVDMYDVMGEHKITFDPCPPRHGHLYRAIVEDLGVG